MSNPETTLNIGEALLAINDIHNLALGSRIIGEYGSCMEQIERIADDILERACNEGSHDTIFVMEDTDDHS